VAHVVVGEDPPHHLDTSQAELSSVRPAIGSGGPHRHEALGAVRTVDDDGPVVVDVDDRDAGRCRTGAEGQRTQPLGQC